jgi:predicted heme/steroid binding protein/uncharacterized membrane protein
MQKRNFIIFISIILSFSFISMLIPNQNYATVELAEQTGKDCGACHINPDGGGELTKEGKTYLLQQPSSYSLRRLIRLVSGFLHIFMGIFWFGTILYIHLVLKPTYAASGLPRREVKIGLLSIIVMAVTGTILTVFRFDSFSSIFQSRFGILLFIKIILFLIMAGSAIFVVFVISPKLRKKPTVSIDPHKRELTKNELSAYDGKEGNPVYIAFKNRIYDASRSPFWKDGTHFGKHNAGIDLTDQLQQAPHGEEKIKNLVPVGELISSKDDESFPVPKKIFFIIAYMNLGLVILIILILALWRWL